MESQGSRCKIVVVGDTQCGKTALLHVFAKDCYPEVSCNGIHVISMHIQNSADSVNTHFDIDLHGEVRGNPSLYRLPFCIAVYRMAE